MAKENESKPKGTKSSDIQAHLDALLSEDDWSSLPTRQSKEKKARRELKLTRRLRETFAEEPETSDEEEIEDDSAGRNAVFQAALKEFTANLLRQIAEHNVVFVIQQVKPLLRIFLESRPAGLEIVYVNVD